MEEKKLCHVCKSNQVARSYQNPLNPDEIEYYCLECYPHLFLEGDEGKNLSQCSYCGTRLSDVVKTQLVGCAHCYTEMWSGIFPLVEKMQGVRAYRGKFPNVGEGSQDIEEERIEKIRYDKRCNELSVLENSARELGDETTAEYYRKKRLALEQGRIGRGEFEC